MSAQTVLVTAASGHVGSELIPRLLKDKTKLVLPTSNASRLRSTISSLATDDNVAIEEGSLKDALWLTEIITKHSVDTVFVCLTGAEELIITLNLLDVMRHCKTVKRLVYVSACGDFVSEHGYRQAIASHAAMHVVVKPVIEHKLLYAGYPWTTVVLGPTLFWVNDLRSKKSLVEGAYFDEPLGQAGLSRVGTEDIAAIARNAIVDHDKWVGKKIMIGSRRRYTGDEIVALWSKALGRQVRMCPADEEGFQTFEHDSVEAMTQAGTPPADAKVWSRDKRLMYEAFAADGFGMTDADYELQIQCLGRQPRDYETFVQETGSSWAR